MECAALCFVIADCCRCIDTKYVKTSVPDIKYNFSNTMTGKENNSRLFTARGDRRNPTPPSPGEGASLSKNCHPGSRRDSCTSSEVRLYSWSASTSIDMSLASCCNSLTRTSELRVRQFIVAIFAWFSLRGTSLLRATNSEECDVLLGDRYFCFLARLSSILLRPWCTMIEQGDTTRPVVVSTEPSEIVKEYENIRHTSLYAVMYE